VIFDTMRCPVETFKTYHNENITAACKINLLKHFQYGEVIFFLLSSNDKSRPLLCCSWSNLDSVLLVTIYHTLTCIL